MRPKNYYCSSKKRSHECCYLPVISRCSALYLNEKVAAVFFGQVFYTSQVFVHNCGIEFTVEQSIQAAAPTLVFRALLQHVQSLLLQWPVFGVFSLMSVVVKSWLFWFRVSSQILYIS